VIDALFLGVVAGQIAGDFGSGGSADRAVEQQLSAEVNDAWIGDSPVPT